MNRKSSCIAVLACITLLAAIPAFAQGQSGSGSSGQSSGSGGNRGNSGSTTSPSQPNRGLQTPMYVEGQVIDDSGQKPSDAVSVKLSCGMRTMQTVKTDIRGYFRFSLGLNNQSNIDLGAADEGAAPPLGGPGGGFGGMGGFGGFGSSGESLTGCDVRISAGGYMPIDMPITDTASLGVIDVGVFHLQRIAPAAPGSVSATSLMVPNNARKEYDQGIKDLQNNRVPQSTQHFQRAVTLYDKYAEAWTQLGRTYAASHDTDKAQQAFEKAIAADPRYAPPYISLGAVKLERQDFEGALDSVGKAAELNPSITTGVAGFIQGLANFELQRSDAAEQSLLQAEKGPHAATPQLHVILADIYLDKKEDATAASHIRAYLKEAPTGPFADEMKQKLDQIDAASNPAQPGVSEAPAVAP